MRFARFVLPVMAGSLVLFAQGNPLEAVPPAPEAPARKISGPTISALEFRGANRVSPEALRAVVSSRVGGAYSEEALREDLRALMGTQRFKSVGAQTEQGRNGAVVRFQLYERPLIESVEILGGDAAISDLLVQFDLRRIRMRAETLLDERELPAAVATVQEMVRERGLRDAIVVPVVEPGAEEATVRVAFRVQGKR